jgi:hypothetical protein
VDLINLGRLWPSGYHSESACADVRNMEIKLNTFVDYPEYIRDWQWKFHNTTRSGRSLFDGISY